MYTVDACMAVKPDNRPSVDELYKASSKILKKCDDLKRNSRK